MVTVSRVVSVGDTTGDNLVTGSACEPVSRRMGDFKMELSKELNLQKHRLDTSLLACTCSLVPPRLSSPYFRKGGSKAWGRG